MTKEGEIQLGKKLEQNNHLTENCQLFSVTSLIYFILIVLLQSLHMLKKWFCPFCLVSVGLACYVLIHIDNGEIRSFSPYT